MHHLKRAAAALALLLPIGAHAQDSWTGPDKVLHFGGSYVIGGLAASRLEPRPAFALCAGVGVAKEFASWGFDRFNRPSHKDMAWNLAGCALGVSLTRWTLARVGDRTQVHYFWEF